MSLQDITRYIEEFSPLAAQRVSQRLRAAGDSLEVHPERGRPVGGSRRELVIVPPYIITYQFAGDQVDTLDIRHGARRPKR